MFNIATFYAIVLCDYFVVQSVYLVSYFSFPAPRKHSADKARLSKPSNIIVRELTTSNRDLARLVFLAEIEVVLLSPPRKTLNRGNVSFLFLPSCIKFNSEKWACTARATGAEYDLYFLGFKL